MTNRQSDRLVDVATSILRALKRPATAQEIIDFARSQSAFDGIAGGKTPHKTLNARIAVDIIKNGDKSRFYRYAPASYGLRESLDDDKHDNNYKKVFIGTSRRKQVSNEPVATVRHSSLRFLKSDGLYTSDLFPLQLLNLLDIRYIDRKFAEEQNDIIQLVSYACVQHEDQVLAFEKGRYTSDNGEFIGKQSIGLGGHVNYYDLSLFDDTPVGLKSNIIRELYEELYIFRNHFRHGIQSISFHGFLVDSSTANGRKHLGLAASVRLKHRLELDTATLGFRNLRWISSKKTPNSFNHFEIWSQYLFRHIQRMSESQD
ncbi:HTH domain-containing protein [Methylorubrum populi]|uniref:HTH domain-containing protein n=1 Tax=Methylorubrum populi TaxID=223967 RepID=UPI003F65ED7C